MEQFLQQIINGISLGSIYALIALGYTMVYGIIKLINFAHGDVYMVEAYIGYFCMTNLRLGFREKGTRLTIEVNDEPGIMSHLAGLFTINGANITHVAVYRGTSVGKSVIVAGINSLNTTDIEKDIQANGYKILYKLQNQ